MTQMTTAQSIEAAQREAPETQTPAIESRALLAGRRELIIRHGTETYRLRLTASNKLILTK